ncbi:hypothetical protein DFH11DRAFT_1735027 [Phellopilus nigrolimitatus]|nr:hypothetical protein DFH11DRAFT_1735027 [Phellopilus nigrolimitatus]
MQFLDLPTEMLAYALEQLALVDLLACRAVCKLLSSLVDSSVALQYNVELGAALKVDNETCPDTRSRKLVEIRRANSAWANFSWAHRVPPIDVRNYAAVYELSGGCFFQDINQDFTGAGKSLPSTLSWIKLPSGRDLQSHDFPSVRGYTIVCNVHLRTISTNEPHPDAAQSVLSVRFNASIHDYAMVVQLCGNHLGVLLTARHTRPARFDMFYLWDWTTGVCKARMSSFEANETWDTFCFVAPDAILLPDTNLGLLNIFLFDDTPESFRHAVSLLLPDTVNNPAIARISVRSEPPPCAPSTHYANPASDTPPFTPDPDSAVVILTLDYVVTPRPAHVALVIDGFIISIAHPQIVAVKRSTLVRFARGAEAHAQEAQAPREQAPREYAPRAEGVLPPLEEERKDDDAVKDEAVKEEAEPEPSQSSTCTHPLPPNAPMDRLAKRVPHIHAEHWVEHHTRWGLAIPPPRWVCYTHGSRFAAMGDRPFGSDRRMGVTLYDFNVRNARRGLDLNADEEESEEWKDREFPVKRSRIVQSFSTIHLPEIFKHDFRTGLPYRITETEEVFDWDSVMLDDERIIGLKEENNEIGGLEHLDVLVM